jgi:2,4-dienoyl-CoA reductase-like NADH-dependent reductase (Old Yellow Enzyme family)
MAEVLIDQIKARGPVLGFTDTANDVALPSEIDRKKAKIFHPLRVGDLTIQHRVVHPALGRSRSAYGAESPLAIKYFAQRTTPGSLMISQATGVSAESAAWQWAASLDNATQQAALSRVIQAVHDKEGHWFQQLFHVGRCTTPALVKLARQRAGLEGTPSYGYRPVSSSAVAESGLNTHSAENAGIPHSLTVEEIHGIQDDFKRAAQRAIEAGADGIEVWPLHRFCGPCQSSDINNLDTSW